MSSIIKFFDRKRNEQITIDTLLYTYLIDIYNIIKTRIQIQLDTGLKIYCTSNTDGLLKQQFFNEYSRLDEMVEMINAKKVKHFELYYKDSESIEHGKHGKQKEDMTPCSYGKVISGYQRYVNKDGEQTVIGDVEYGAFITIPKGALGANTNISIQTVEVSDSFFKNSLGNQMQNVTLGVGYNTKANDYVNKNHK